MQPPQQLNQQLQPQLQQDSGTRTQPTEASPPISPSGHALYWVATSGTLNGLSIQSLSLYSLSSHNSQFEPLPVSSNPHPILPYLLSLSSLIPHSRLMKIRELIENSRPTIFIVVLCSQIHSLCLNYNSPTSTRI